ncbi:unnamed protein product [Linum tenue]|uniref:Uncharacterized protein n=1 Tax=Linum tenue TaxID=586396 RepID=A0AAV0NLY0_9ROSI|nr:unnamed protein product [Linum tenue]
MKEKLLKLEEKMGLHRFISKQIEEASLLGNSYCNLAYVTNKLLEPELRIGCRINNYLRIEIVLDHHLLSDDLKKKLKTMQDDFNKQSEKGS